eukprot:456037_1
MFPLFNKRTSIILGCGIAALYGSYSYYRYHLDSSSNAQSHSQEDNEPPSEHPSFAIWASSCSSVLLSAEELDAIQAHYEYAQKHLNINGTLVLKDKWISRHNKYEFRQLIEDYLRNGLYSKYTIYVDASIDCFSKTKQCNILLEFEVDRDFNLVKKHLQKSNNVINVSKDIKIVVNTN